MATPLTRKRHFYISGELNCFIFLGIVPKLCFFADFSSFSRILVTFWGSLRSFCGLDFIVFFFMGHAGAPSELCGAETCSFGLPFPGFGYRFRCVFGRLWRNLERSTRLLKKLSLKSSINSHKTSVVPEMVISPLENDTFTGVHEMKGKSKWSQ